MLIVTLLVNDWYSASIAALRELESGRTLLIASSKRSASLPLNTGVSAIGRAIVFLLILLALQLSAAKLQLFFDICKNFGENRLRKWILQEKSAIFLNLPVKTYLLEKEKRKRKEPKDKSFCVLSTKKEHSLLECSDFICPLPANMSYYFLDA